MATTGMSISLKVGLLHYLFKRGRVVDDSATGGFPPSPTSVWISLHTGDPTRSGVNAIGTEVFGIGYARVEIPTDADPTTHVNWYDVLVVGDEVSISNKVNIQFPVAGTGGWSNAAMITHYAVWRQQAVTEEAYLCYGALAVPISIRLGDIVRFDGNPPSGPGKLSIHVV